MKLSLWWTVEARVVWEMGLGSLDATGERRRRMGRFHRHGSYLQSAAVAESAWTRRVQSGAPEGHGG